MTETETPPTTPEDQLRQQLQILNLKYTALKERLSQLVVEYEDKDTDRRVEITYLRQTKEELEDKVRAYETEQAEEQNAKPVSD